MKKVLCSVLLLMLWGTTMAYAEYENPSVVGQVPDRVVITLEKGLFPKVTKAANTVGVDIPALDALAQRFEIENMSLLYDFVGAPKRANDPDLRLVWSVDFPVKYDLETVRAAYAALPEVVQVQAVDICKMYDVPNDIDANQWYLRNMTLGGKDIRGVGGWAEARGDTNIVIAIVDSGVDWMHPDLGGPHPDHVNGAVWTNWTEYYGSPGVDDDSNNKIDDIRGWDFVNVPGNPGYPDEDYLTPDNDPMDYESHGTACAGCAAAITDNGLGIAGTSWGCKIMAVRVGWLPNGETQGVVRMDFASQGMIYAALNGADIVNCSWGSTSFLSMAVQICVNEGVIIITAAGNDNDQIPSYLGGHADVLAAAATQQDDVKASFSSFGHWVNICAPGVGIYTTWWNQGGSNHTYNSVQGTSFSSPISCGAAALIWSAHPGWNRVQVMNLLLNSCDNIDDLNPGFEGLLGSGRINLLKALGDSFQEIPDEFPTLLDAMNEAAPGDIVAVLGSEILSGTQTIIAKELHLLGGYNASYTSRDPVGNPTTISTLASSTALQFQGGTTTTTVVDGFLCTGGGGTFFASPFNGRYGGGVVINQTSPTLRNIEVTGNSVGSFSEFGGGGGIVMFNSNAVLENVRVHGNSAIHGAGIFIHEGGPTLTGCGIYDNTSFTDNLGFTPLGGGFYVSEADVTMNGCRISGHTDLESGGGIYATGTGTMFLTMTDNEIYDNFVKSFGGGIYMTGEHISMRRDSVHDNGFTATATFSNGGGIYVSGATAEIDSIACQDNSAHAGAGCLIDNSPSADVTNSLFTGNLANFYGGGIALQSVAASNLTGNTVAVNDAQASGGAGIYISNASPTIANNISVFNTGGTFSGNGVHLASGSATFSCNDVYGNDGDQYGGVADPTGTDGNISADPLFCEQEAGNFNIDSTSPCAPDHSGGCGLIGALSANCISDPVPEGDGEVPLVFKVVQNFPNPFNPATTIRFSLPQDGFTIVRIFDLAGRLVNTLLAEDLQARVYDVTWNGRDGAGRVVAAGVYFYQVKSGADSFTGRMALVK